MRVANVSLDRQLTPARSSRIIMPSRIPSTLVVLITAALVAVAVPRRAATAQDQSSFRLLQAVGTPDEKPLIDAITNRARSKFTGDLQFATRVHEAMLKRDF